MDWTGFNTALGMVLAMVLLISLHGGMAWSDYLDYKIRRDRIAAGLPEYEDEGEDDEKGG